MMTSEVLRIQLYGSWEQSTASLWLLSSLKENHLGSRPIKTVSRLVQGQRWEVIREEDTHAWVIQGGATELTLIQGIQISTLGCCKTHSAALFCGLLFPPSKLHEMLRLLYPPLTFARSLFLGVFSWNHSKLERLIYFYACQNSSWRRWGDHRAQLEHVFCHEDNGQVGTVWLAVWEWVQPGGTWIQTVVEALGHSISYFLPFWAGSSVYVRNMWPAFWIFIWTPSLPPSNQEKFRSTSWNVNILIKVCSEKIMLPFLGQQSNRIVTSTWLQFKHVYLQPSFSPRRRFEVGDLH